MGMLALRKDSVDVSRVIRFVTIFSFFLFFFISLLRMQVSNVDFWWHLATGKYIVENQSLPQNDPFLHTSHDTPSVRKSFILRGYWLAQVFFYGVYSLWDLKGIIVLRAIFLLALLFFVFLIIRKQKVSKLVSLLLISGVFSYCLVAEGERPQLFTFFVFSLVYYLLEDFRINRSKKIFLIPVSVMLLSNMHPGYIVCILLISIYLAGEGIRYFFRKGCDDNIFKGLLMIWILSIVFSFLNPNGGGIFIQMISKRFFTQDTMHVVEMLPTFHLYGIKMIPVDYSYIAFLSVSLLSLWYFKKIGAVHMLLLIVFTLMSLVAYRYMMFYMCISAPILAKIIVNLREERVFRRSAEALKAKEGFLFLIAGVTGVFLFFNALTSFAGFRLKGNEFFAVPKGAADFLSDVEIKGNMFNEYGFGGYLVWRLYPEKMVFIDTRSLEPDITYEYRVVAFAIDRPHLSWKGVIKKYNISYFVIQPLWQNGKIMPVVEELFDSKEWVLIYADHLSLIFVRKDSDNSSVIEKYEIDKKKGTNTIIAQASAWALIGNQINPNYLITLGKIFFKMGKLDDAERAFLMAYERAPDNPLAEEWLQKLRENEYKTDRIKGN